MLYMDAIRPSLEILTYCTSKYFCSLEDKAVLYQPEGRGFGALCNA
jgi:hypothetical protein